MWIESHQDLATNPKTRKAARALQVSIPAVMGHLHCLWHWALDHAEDGDVSAFDVDDIAIAAMWDGDPEAFVAALRDCGPGDKAGFLEVNGAIGDPGEDQTAALALHDWWQYAGKLVAKRRKDAARKARSRAETDDESGGRPQDVPRTPPLVGTDGSADGAGTEPNQPTEQTEPQNPPSPDGDDTRGGESDAEDPAVDDAASTFELFWQMYPARNGVRKGRGNALIEWRKLTLEQRRRAFIGARNLAASTELPKDAERFLRRAKGGRGDFPFDDWQTTPAAGATSRPGSQLAPEPRTDIDDDDATPWQRRDIA